ncbi:MAG: family 10 glycosylhydrolase [Puniceicoccales bacterium]|jgi:uncharacterized lipoprotein YddW (UPF0748 family)|nr:family 10 glycosylhydrolase [Puniceicoccales bacterium]
MRTHTLFLSLLATAICALPLPAPRAAAEPDKPVKAFCIDFNWGPGGRHGFARPGLWADANPKEHVDWYAALGCDVIQSFAVSCNGYAWYKNGAVPEQPGLKHDFLTELVKEGRKRNMKVFGYFCIGANNRWEKNHPDLCYRTNGQQIPLTTEYLDYLCAAIEEAVKKTDMDGFMIDWLYNPGGGRDPLPTFRWLPCEQKMYRELMGVDFPGKDKVSRKTEIVFRRRAIDRAWKRIRETTKRAKPTCIVWLSAYDINSKEYENTTLLKEVDWVMNEAGDAKTTAAMRKKVGKHTRLITCLANWNGQDPLKIVPAAAAQGVSLYGFTKPTKSSLLPPISYYLSRPLKTLKGDELNIAVLARHFNGLPLQ